MGMLFLPLNAFTFPKPPEGCSVSGASNPLCTFEPNELDESGSVRKGRYEPFLAWRPHFFNLGDLPLDLHFYRGSGEPATE